MLHADYPAFEAMIRTLEKVYTRVIDDDTVKAYWGALHDLPLDIVQRRVEHHTKTSKFFPKPSELRPKDDRSYDGIAKKDPTFERALADNIKFWDEEIRMNPQGKRMLLSAYCARVMTMDLPSENIRAQKLAFARDVDLELSREEAAQ